MHKTYTHLHSNPSLVLWLPGVSDCSNLSLEPLPCSHLNVSRVLTFTSFPIYKEVENKHSHKTSYTLSFQGIIVLLCAWSTPNGILSC